MGWGFWDGGNAVSISSAVLWLKQTIRREATGEDGRTMTHSSRARRERILRIWYAETRTQPLSTDCWKQDSHWLVSVAVYHEHKRLSRTSAGLSFEFWPLISKSVHSKRGEGQHLPSELVYLHRKRKICATFLGKEMIIPEHVHQKRQNTPWRAKPPAHICAAPCHGHLLARIGVPLHAEGHHAQSTRRAQTHKVRARLDRSGRQPTVLSANRALPEVNLTMQQPCLLYGFVWQ